MREKLNKVVDVKINDMKLLEGGFSLDKKFVINDDLLIRVGSVDRYEKFLKTFDTQYKFSLVSRTQKPIKVVKDDDYAYYVTKFIKGESGDKIVHNMPTKLQYELGLEAGEDLYKFHISNMIVNFDMKQYIDFLVDRKINQAKEDNLINYIPRINEVIEVINDNKHLLYDYKGVLNHSDYHLSNMIFSDNSYLGAIDFERCREGIFITDFRSVAPFISRECPAFAKGLIDGYNKDLSLEEFFKLYNLINLITFTGALSWHLIFDKKGVDEMARFINQYIDLFIYIDRIPDWYLQQITI